MQCEMCGKEGQVFTTLLEGTSLQLCAKCGTYGKVLMPPSGSPQKIGQRKAVPQIVEPTLGIVTDYADRIRRARERLGLTQKEFAAKLNEKESILHKLETGTYEPPIELARKLEKLLHITLVEEQQDERPAAGSATGGNLTIGDVIKTQRR